MPWLFGSAGAVVLREDGGASAQKNMDSHEKRAIVNSQSFAFANKSHNSAT